jgi:RecB family endonuclease NucS
MPRPVALAVSEKGQYGPPTMRLVVARCEVHYTGRLTAVLPEAVRLLVFKADGSVLVHDDAGGYKPLNCIRTEFRPAVVKSA